MGRGRRRQPDGRLRPGPKTVDNVPAPSPAPTPPAPAAAPRRAPVVTAWLERGGAARPSVTAALRRARPRRAAGSTTPAGAPARRRAARRGRAGPRRGVVDGRSPACARSPDGRFTRVHAGRAVAAVAGHRARRCAQPSAHRARARAGDRAGVAPRRRRSSAAACAAAHPARRRAGRAAGAVRPPLGHAAASSARSRSGRFAGRLDWVARGRLAVRARVPRQPGLPFAAGLARGQLRPPRRAGRTGPGTSR